MLSERFQLKMYLEPSAHLEIETLVPVFHRFIREQLLKELVIDVVDYSHVPSGPGVVLIGHAADYYVGELDGRLGLVFSRKRAAPPPDSRLEDGLRHLVNVARLLEQDVTVKLRFRTNDLSLRLTDRLHTGIDDAAFAQAKAEVEQVFGKIYGGVAAVERIVEDGGPLGLAIKASSAPTLEALLEKLGGPASS